MRRLLGVMVVVALALGAWIAGSVEGEPPLPPGPGQLVVLPPVVHQQVQQVVVVDQRQRAIAVYHIDLTSGGIRLKAVRQIGWDLMLENFNGATPLPREVRTLVQTSPQGNVSHTRD